MLRQVFIVKDGKIIYKRSYGKALDDDSYNHIYKVISKGIFDIQADKLDSYEYLKYRITYQSIQKYRVIILIITGLADKSSAVKKEIERLKKDFLNNFEMILEDDIDEDTFEIFHSSVDSAHKNLRPKISLVGFSGVGKTTITRLIQANEIPVEHVPTITGDIATIKIGKLHFHLWDFAGQEQFSYLWDNFIKGSDAVLIISDSTLENVEKSKFFIELVKKQAGSAHAACIGNKQDLPDHMPISDMERHLGVKTYSMVASDPNNRDKMITIIADILDMSAEVSPLLAPLLERDTKLSLAEKAIEDGDWQLAINLYEELSNLCITLGDDNVSKIFMDRAAQLQSLLQKSQAMAPAPAVESPSEETAGPQLTAPTAPAKPAGPQLTAPLSPPKPAGPQLTAPLSPPKPAGPQLTAPTAPAKPAGPQLTAPLSPPKPAGPQLTTPLIPPKPAKIEVADDDFDIPVQSPPPRAPIQTPSPPPSAPTQQPAGGMDALSAILANLKTGGNTPAPPAAVPPAPPVANKPIINPRGTVNPLDNLQAPPSTPQFTPPKQPLPTPQFTPPTQPLPISPAAVPVATTPSVSPPSSDANQIKKSINDIKLKIMNVDNTILDLELKNISGDLSDEEFAEKNERLIKMKQTLETQKTNYESMLG